MPGVHEATVFVDTPACQVGAQVAALATHSEVVAVVANGVPFDADAKEQVLAVPVGDR